MKMLLVLMAISVPSALAFSNGTSKMHHVCKTLKPHHNESVPQTGAAPYQVTTAKDRVPIGGPVLVSLVSRTGTPFKGFMLQARPRPLRKLTPFGAFQLLDASRSRLMDCVMVANDTVTHNSPVPKTHISFKWFPPKGFRGDVYFEATFVQSFAIFWTKLVKKVSVGQTDDSMNNDIVDAAHDLSVRDFPQFQDMYKGCGSVKQCFGMPQNCEGNGTCHTLVSVTTLISKFEFEIFGSGSDYVAINLTRNDRQDKNIIVECFLLERDVIINNVPQFNEHNSIFPSNIQLIQSSFVDGSIHCGFFHNHSLVEVVNEFKMEKYSLLLTSKKTETQRKESKLFDGVVFNTTKNTASVAKDHTSKEEKIPKVTQNKSSDFFMWVFMIMRMLIRLI